MTGLGVEELFIPPPGFAPRRRPEVFVKGSRYEHRVAAKLAEPLGAKLHLSPWLPGPCQPDAILEFSTSLILVETKLSSCDARAQLRKYACALAPAGKQIWMVQIAKNVSASFPPTVSSLYDLSAPFEVLHWWL